MSKPQSYWEKRKARELYEELVKAEDTAEEMRQLYIASSNEIKEEAVKLARRFQLRHNLSVKEAERLLARALDPEDIKNMIEMLKQDPQNAELAAELESQAYASRINRLMAVQSSIDTVANEIYRRSNAATTAVLQDIGQSMYYKQIFEMQQRAGAAFGFMPLDPDRLIGIINRRWSGQNFSERLWNNREQLAAEVKKQLLLGILTGRANRKMAQEIDGRFSVSYNNTRRLVRTEANYVANQLQAESYKDTSVDKYIYVAILDLRTSEICRDLDKKRFLVSNAVVGENYPPMHPWCRSTTIAWMPDQLLKKLQQSAIDPATGETITVPGDMTYQEWYDKYVRDKNIQPDLPQPGSNLTAEQHEKYRAIFKDEIPDSRAEFIQMKAEDPDKWERLKAEKQDRINSMPFSEMQALKGKLGKSEVRNWYKHQLSLFPKEEIAKMPLESAAKFACDFRNRVKVEARDLMRDQEARRLLDISDPPEPFEELLMRKMDEKSLTREEAMHDIIYTVAKTRKSVDERYAP